MRLAGLPDVAWASGRLSDSLQRPQHDLVPPARCTATLSEHSPRQVGHLGAVRAPRSGVRGAPSRGVLGTTIAPVLGWELEPCSALQRRSTSEASVEQAQQRPQPWGVRRGSIRARCSFIASVARAGWRPLRSACVWGCFWAFLPRARASRPPADAAQRAAAQDRAQGATYCWWRCAGVARVAAPTLASCADRQTTRVRPTTRIIPPPAPRRARGSRAHHDVGVAPWRGSDAETDTMR